ncbi:MAG: hypothetical protein EA401_06135 [Planctomycetota bacterium]|nr:MAG: hypothetical protein EA401_06135 [Planctomycetota bacterium]
MPQRAYQLEVAVPVSRLWAFHNLPDAVERLSPADAGIRVLRHDSPLRDGGETLLSLPFLPGARMGWLARLSQVEAERGFIDEQVEGPMAYWRHEHVMQPLGDHASLLIDRIQWRLRWWQLPPLGNLIVGRKLDTMFAHRHAVTTAWCLQPEDSAEAESRSYE